MQLNNKTSHQITVINKITNGIIFETFSNDLKQNSTFNSVVWQLDKNQPTGLKTINEFELEKAYEYLLTLPEFIDYELSNSKNWKFDDNSIRLIVDNKKLMLHMLANDATGHLVSYVLSDVNIKQHTIAQANEEFVYIYLSFILPEHMTIIESSDAIILEYYDK